MVGTFEQNNRKIDWVYYNFLFLLCFFQIKIYYRIMIGQLYGQSKYTSYMLLFNFGR